MALLRHAFYSAAGRALRLVFLQALKVCNSKGQYKDPVNGLQEQWCMVWAGGEQCLGSRGVTIAVPLLKCHVAN